MTPGAAVAGVSVALVVFLALVVVGEPDDPRPAMAGSGGSAPAAAGFSRALEPRTLHFPEDHGAHPRFRTEWWYFTGNLHTGAARPFGFELSFFRLALAPDRGPRSSAWAANQVYMAHFALTDPANRRHDARERFDRAALDLAGAQARPLRVWLDDWVAASEGDAPFPLRLVAQDDSFGIDLELEASKPAVEQGVNGWSRKGPEAGNASYYYSFTRLTAAGHVRTGDEHLAVTGQAWMDHEWGTSALGADIAGWDWFALQLDDGTELMFYRLRRSSGAGDPLSAGSLVAADGHRQALAAADVLVEEHGDWISPATGITYPMGWRLEVPRRGIALDVTPRLRNQEMALSVRYWEGAVAVAGRSGDRAVRGEGYVELTGYGDANGSWPGR